MSWFKNKVKGTLYRHIRPKGEYRYISTLSLSLALEGVGWLAPRPSRITPRKDPVSLVREAGWAPGPVWTGAEDLVPTRIQFLDRSARWEQLYRLAIPVHNVMANSDELIGTTEYLTL
jgi:hypothetical protein